ncbi:pyrroline-5-carboxylate reductase [Caldanaerobacter subterraneus KAk]|uniref:pyrroline-5-carboxylate reductase n=1 Tax=Caldanaerobacter subterraneus TaxID=911092 RepID=UPI0032C15107
MKIGFIGAGNMGMALIKGILKSDFVEAEDLILYDPVREKVEGLEREFGTVTAKDNLELTEKSDVVIVAVKPNVYDEVLKEIREKVTEEKIMITIAPGITIDHVKKLLGKGKIVRTIPNTPALIGEGITAITYSEEVEEEDKELVRKIFSTCGEIVEIEEKLIDVAMAVSSCSPAFVYMFIEALADGGVLLGLPRDVAYKLASKAVSGAGSMVFKTGFHPGQLKDMVTSPGGTTIEGIRVLEKNGMRSAVIEAVIAAYQKAKGLK